jgi:serine/threonine protein kinase
MGEVFRARDDRLERDVAVKIIRPASSADQDRIRRFEQEARAAAALYRGYSQTGWFCSDPAGGR